MRTALDLAGFCDTAEDVRYLFRQRLSQEDVESAVAAWIVACHSSHRQVGMLAQALANTAPTPATSACLSGIASTTPASSLQAAQPRSWTPIALPTQVAGPVETPAISPADMAKARILDELMDLYYQLGSQGLHWEQVAAQDVLAHRELLKKVPAKLTVAHLATFTRAWRRWTSWQASRPDISLWSPSAVHLGLFLQEETKCGPTVAPASLGALKWLRQNIGIPLPVESPCVAAFAHPPSSHVASQAKAFSPADFWNLVSAVQQAQPGASQEAQVVLFAMLACLRFKHMQRSRLLKMTQEFVFGLCTKGKSRRRGTRHPYGWAVPILSFLPPGTFGFLADLAQRLNNPVFLFPIKRSATRTRFMPRWSSKPMTYAQFVGIMRMIVGVMQYSSEEASAVTYNTARRFLPTACNVLGFDAHTAQAIGSWVEIPHGAEDDHSKGSMHPTSYPPITVTRKHWCRAMLCWFCSACARHVWGPGHPCRPPCADGHV